MPGFTVEIPFAEMLGLELISFEGGRAELALTLRDELTNSRDMAHGGVSMTLLDVAMAHAARSPDQPGQPENQGVLTIEMKTTFMRPGVGRLRAIATLIQRTHTLAFCEATLLDADDAVLARASGTFKYIKGSPDGARRRQSLDASN